MTEQIFIRAEVIGELPSGQKKVRLLAGQTDGIRFFIDRIDGRGIIPAADISCGGWISVKDRLPEKAEDYLCRCYIDKNEFYPFHMVLRYYLVDEKPHFQHECEHGLKVTHWMPIPKLPKEGEM